MFRQFASREIVSVAMVVTGFTIVCCILLYTFIKADMMKDSIRYEAALSDTVLGSMRYAMLRSNHEGIDQIMSDIGALEQVKYVRIFQCTGIVKHSSDINEKDTIIDMESGVCKRCHKNSEPATELTTMERASVHFNEDNERILSLMTPIYNEKGCSTEDCHFHPPDKVLLGGMDIGLSQENLIGSLALLRLRMMVFCVMILVLTLGGVTALLWRTVMLPLTRLADFAEERAKGNFDSNPPRGTGDIRRLVDAIEKMESKGEGGED